MCGIAGILTFDDQAVQIEDLKLILDKLKHRGQDQHNIIVGTDVNLSQSIALGHRRLSIIDLNESAAQPMFYANKTLCLTYNGEIYNYLELKHFLKNKGYEFSTKSDSEVLLAAYHYWGQECVNHLNGMFSFAIWDEKKRHLFCVRDQLGIKPFYFLMTKKFFAFASEAQALAHLNQYNLNQDALFAYLLSMYIPNNESIFSCIQKLPPAHSLLITKDGKFSQSRFWKINQFANISASDENISNLETLLNKAIKNQLQSDVPVGSFLSGGIDSGFITALAASQVNQFHTYSVGYEGMLDNELPQARNLAQRYATKHTEITITAADAMTYLNKALSKMSEPIADPASVATYMLAELAAKDGVKVLLNGTGGDEIFAGYTRYSGQLSFKRKLFLLTPLIFKNLMQYLPINIKTKLRLKHVSLDMLFSTGGSYDLVQQMATSKKYVVDLLNKLANDLRFVYDASIPLLYKQMLFDIHAYLPEELLFLLDQMTMAHTIEGRVPLLDIDVVKYAFNFHAHAHATGKQTKILLKRTALPHLGSLHISRKKQGFAGSPIWWVKNNYKKFIEVVAELNRIPIFANFNIDQFNKNSNANDIFLLYCLSKWYENKSADFR